MAESSPLYSHEQELVLLYEISALNRQIESDTQLFELAFDKASRLLGSEIVIFYLAEQGEDLLHARAARGVRLARVAPTLSLSASQRQLLIEPGPCEDARLPTPLGADYPLRAALGLPLQRNQHLLGWLYVARVRRAEFSPQERALYLVLGEQIARALEMRLAWDQQQAQQAQLAAANASQAQLLAEMSAAHERQAQLLATIRELSTPVLALDRQTLLIPLIGMLDSTRAALVQEQMLQAISARQARRVILDISGVVAVDEAVLVALIQAAQAAGLLGARVILCGISPEVAQAIISSGLSLQLTTTHDLRAAIALTLRST
jgi:rsbT co-antagonist protein RsbR